MDVCVLLGGERERKKTRTDTPEGIGNRGNDRNSDVPGGILLLWVRKPCDGDVKPAFQGTALLKLHGSGIDALAPAKHCKRRTRGSCHQGLGRDHRIVDRELARHGELEDGTPNHPRRVGVVGIRLGVAARRDEAAVAREDVRYRRG